MTDAERDEAVQRVADRVRALPAELVEASPYWVLLEQVRALAWRSASGGVWWGYERREAAPGLPGTASDLRILRRDDRI